MRRKYTVTLKPVAKDLKGDKEALLKAFNRFLGLVGGQNNHLSVEHAGKPSVHLHALISCETIKDKTHVSKQLVGYRLHTQIILYKDYDNIEDIWLKYTNKEKSDADRYTLLYGCMIPVEDNTIDYNNI